MGVEKKAAGNMPTAEGGWKLFCLRRVQTNDMPMRKVCLEKTGRGLGGNYGLIH